MNVYRRYFRITNGPVIDHVSKAIDINTKAHKEYIEILNSFALAHDGYHHNDRKMVGISFKQTPDRDIFKRTKNGWWPKKTSFKGREILKRIEEVETVSEKDALQLLGLGRGPRLFKTGLCYFATLTTIPENPPVVYITVPWCDRDPEEVQQYKEQRKNKTSFDANLDALLWTPSPEMEEVKEWEVKKHIDSWNYKNTIE
jgi:hypothetical protein